MLLHKKNGKTIFIYSLVTFILICLMSNLFAMISFPDEINVIQGQSQKIKDSLLFDLSLDNNKQKNIELSSKMSNLSSFMLLHGNNQGSAKGYIKLFGKIPVKTVTVNVIPDIKLVPSGEAIGVKIESKGLLVVGLSSITGAHSRKYTPAADAGFEIGDTILQINGQKVEKERDIIDILNEDGNKGKKLNIVIEREKQKMSIAIQPVLCADDNLYKIGLWVRDSIAGVGTMTFYDPVTGKFGALGHGITDIDSGVLIDINKGSILKSKIASVKKARKSVPGEIVGIFYETEAPYGKIQKNTSFGIYGKVDSKNASGPLGPMPIGLSYQVKEGPAKILSTIEDNQIAEYDIEIQKVTKQRSADSKSMLIKVTDPRLLEKTGGIVQGMSGSPIIQDGKLIGAVTHVLVNDPTRGYGIFIEWMLGEAEIDTNQSANTLSAAVGL